LVIDDGSPDGTVTAAKEGTLHPERLAVLQRTAKRGLGSAYRNGFRWANDHGATIVATLDADLSHDPADLPRLVTALEGRLGRGRHGRSDERAAEPG
jgi:dolichol-phosphate mannosyltransferase